MSLLTWQNDYSVGVKELDQQHRKMFDLINQFYDSMIEARNKDNVKKTLKELVEYSHSHLATEEKYFKKFSRYR